MPSPPSSLGWWPAWCSRAASFAWPTPMIDLRLFRIRAFNASLATNLLGRGRPTQEIYGYLCVYYAIRWLMHAVALEAGHDPDRLSFHPHAAGSPPHHRLPPGLVPLRPWLRRTT